MICRTSLAVAMGLPSSLTATIPACFIAAISAIASPLLATLAAPMGHTRTLAAAFARSRMKRVTLALSFTGLVLGMQQTAVKPPRAAAFVPVSIVSEDSCPGSRRCACRSIKPGATSDPVASKISKPFFDEIFPAGATSAMRSPSKRTSKAPSIFLAGSRTRPFLTSSMRGILYVRGASVPRLLRLGGGMCSFFGQTRSEQKEQGHAHGDSVADLLQHARLRRIRDVWRNFDPAIHRPGMQHDGVRFRMAQAPGVELVQQNVIILG